MGRLSQNAYLSGGLIGLLLALMATIPLVIVQQTRLKQAAESIDNTKDANGSSLNSTGQQTSQGGQDAQTSAITLRVMPDGINLNSQRLRWSGLSLDQLNGQPLEYVHEILMTDQVRSSAPQSMPFEQLQSQAGLWAQFAQCKQVWAYPSSASVYGQWQTKLNGEPELVLHHQTALEDQIDGTAPPIQTGQLIATQGVVLVGELPGGQTVVRYLPQQVDADALQPPIETSGTAS